LALMSGITGGAEVILIPEIAFPLEEVAERVENAYIRGKTHAIIVVAEGAAYSVDEIVQYLAERQTGFEVRVTLLGHVQRGGRPTHFDRLLATRMGVAAVNALMAGEIGVMIGLDGRQVRAVPLEEVTSR